MNGIFFSKTHSVGWIISASLLLITSCRLNPNEPQNATQASEQETTQETTAVSPSGPAEEAVIPDNENSFTPSPTTALPLIERSDGYFDTSVKIRYQDPSGKVWKAPAGTVTDGASIPRLFKGFFGGRLNEEYLFAAIVHDAYCAAANVESPLYQSERWQDTHRMFYYACLNNGASRTKASTMYAAVRLAGPRWPFQGEPFTSLSNVEDSVLLEEMKRCEAWITSKGDSVTLEEIDTWMDNREQQLLNKG